MTTLYVAGPMRGKAMFNFPAFDEARDRLRAAGYTVVSPADLDRGAGFDPKNLTVREYNECEAAFWGITPSWFNLSDAMKRDLEAVKRCDGVALLDGWVESGGAQLEVETGLAAGKPCRRVEQWIEAARDGSTILNETKPSPRAALLREAESLVCGDRNNQYGPPTADFDRTAGMLSAMGYTRDGKPLVAHDVALIMAALKLSRLCWQPGKRDSWTDLAGYAACGWECAAAAKQEEPT